MSDLPPEIVTPPPGPRSRELAARLAAVECPAVDARRAARARASGAEHAPIAYARGQGSNVWDVDGNRYVDLAAGFGALPLGHAHPAVTAAARAQMEQLTLALGDVYAHEAKAALCARLAALFPEPGARVMLGLSGADAVTAALKTAVLATGRPGVVAFEGSYHGLSYAPLAACGLSPAFREPFAAQLGGHVTFLPYPRTAEDAERVLARGDLLREAGAVLVEPLLGRGGCVAPPDGFLPALREACDRTGALLVADEVWTGLGRTGAMLASVAAGVVPDVVCLGKALGGGFPVSACVGRARVMEAWGARGGATIHTATHFGWPVACRASLATLDEIAARDLPRRAREAGERLRGALSPRFSVAGRGLMVGVPLGSAARALRTARALLERGFLVLTGGADGASLTLSPPLTIAEDLLDVFAAALAEAAGPA